MHLNCHLDFLSSMMPIFEYQSIHMVAYVVVAVDAAVVAAAAVVDVADGVVALFPDIVSILRPLSKFQQFNKTKQKIANEFVNKTIWNWIEIVQANKEIWVQKKTTTTKTTKEEKNTNEIMKSKD